jgi:hypothetical protein
MSSYADGPGSETLRVDGYIVTRGCCLSTSGKWWPIASVGEDGGAPQESVAFGETDLRDSPEQARQWADVLTRQWIRERRHRESARQV